VPPVLSSVTPNSFTRAVANSFSPVLSDTEISVRFTCTKSLMNRSEKESEPRYGRAAEIATCRNRKSEDVKT